MRPEATRSRTFTHEGWRRYMKASTSTRPVRSAADFISRPSAEDSPIGFSHSTCLPASRAAMVHGACRWLGRGR